MDKNELKKLNHELRDEREERGKRRFHSDSYHRHFEGYSEFYAVDDKGKTVLKRAYTGEYYTLNLTKKGVSYTSSCCSFFGPSLLLSSSAVRYSQMLATISGISCLGKLLLSSVLCGWPQGSLIC